MHSSDNQYVFIVQAIPVPCLIIMFTLVLGEYIYCPWVVQIQYTLDIGGTMGNFDMKDDIVILSYIVIVFQFWYVYTIFGGGYSIQYRYRK